ncbi:small integral membrane protein 22 isoform X2 [Rousettus aegyptiacus]|uniref:Small integral membrane protein 22 n=1 Tax=Rousettus aegyptiacus TaxID=9407 RepID=A0A7J8F3W1_ROUAE|nr:small integral membrane protein 22 isoform X2 [Rousettus aegyptiacus]KAF6442353.1 small integral membrane protein 22 [Rousettus aegyptiacus]
MDNPEELQPIVEEVLGKLKSSQPFQSTWDTAAFVVFLTFVGTVLLLLLFVCIHCCCCRHRSSRSQVNVKKGRSMGVDNLALEP